MSDVPYGVFLSGGIDSSILVAAASKVSSQELNTFSIVFKDKIFDERKFSRTISSQYKTAHNEIEIHPDELLNQIEEPFKFMDHPSVDGINTFFISKAVHGKGFKMALSGAGSDELFSGYPVFKNTFELNNKKWLYSFPPQLRKLASKLITYFNPNEQSKKIGEILNLRLLELPYYYPVFRKIFTDIDIKKIMSNDINLKSSYPFQWGIKELSFKERGDKLSFLNKVSSLEIETYLQNVLLRDADQMGMANSLEIRVPFLDHRLVEYVLSLSDELKYPEYPKQLLVDSFKGWIPEDIIKRKKMGFIFPWEKWMKNELKDFCSESIKHLETIQGDERDAIILATGYGPKAIGKLRNDFGVLNRSENEFGLRRLNVAITRARKRVDVVTTIKPYEYDDNQLTNVGAKGLIQYLRFVQSGGSDLGDLAVNKIPMNEFEQDIFDALTRKGIGLVPQYGVSGYRLDFAVQHPDEKGRFVLALEADGASYHSSDTARDRDRIRQNHLERLGWKFHRIWSTDWFLNKEQELELAVMNIEQAIRSGDLVNPPQKS